MKLKKCPFCSEVFFPKDQRQCDFCAVDLVEFDHTELREANDPGDDMSVLPEEETLPWFQTGRGQGLLPALSLAGIALFWSPWIHVSQPDVYSLSGAEVARRIVWVWAVPVAWGILIPTVLSRRTIAELWGARLAAAMLAAMPSLTATILISFPPRVSVLHIEFRFAWGLFATLMVSFFAIFLSLFQLGGRLDDIKLQHGSSRGQRLH
jgi:hypothetical protein